MHLVYFSLSWRLKAVSVLGQTQLGANSAAVGAIQSCCRSQTWIIYPASASGLLQHINSMQQCAVPKACNPELPNIGLSCGYNPRLAIIHLGLIQFCEFLLVLNLSLLVCNIKYTKSPSFAPLYLIILLLLFYFIFLIVKKWKAPLWLLCFKENWEMDCGLLSKV